jgi:hypothetical protein
VGRGRERGGGRGGGEIIIVCIFVYYIMVFFYIQAYIDLFARICFSSVCLFDILSSACCFLSVTFILLYGLLV